MRKVATSLSLFCSAEPPRLVFVLPLPIQAPTPHYARTTIPTCSAAESFASCAQMNFSPSLKHWLCNHRPQRADATLSLLLMVVVVPSLAAMPLFVQVWRYPSSVSRL